MLTTEGAATCGVAAQRRFAPTRRQVRPFAGDVLQDATALYSDTRAALGAAGVNYPSATHGFHANSEAVGLFAAGNGRLVGTFHDYSRLKNLYKEKICCYPREISKRNSALSCFFCCPSRCYVSSPGHRRRLSCTIWSAPNLLNTHQFPSSGNASPCG